MTAKTQSKGPAPQPTRILKMPMRTQEVELNGNWTGWKFTTKTSLTMGDAEDLASGDFGRINGALARLIQTWNFCDETGQPLPDPAAIRQETYTDEAGKPLEGENAKEEKDKRLRELMAQLHIELALDVVAGISNAFQESSRRLMGKG